MTTVPYRPSNGTEGMIFDDAFCSRCVRDKAYRDGGMQDGALGCTLLADALCFDIDHPKYPKEWVWEGCDEDGCFSIGQDGARCTAFEEIKEWS